MEHLKKWVRSILLVVVATALLLIALPIIPFLFLGSRLWAWWLRRCYVAKWGQSGKPILLVYSNSPNWRAYIEENWLPRLHSHAVILNWSERSQWSDKCPFEARVFRHFAGSREFNPIAIYLPSSGNVRIFRFWQAFKDFKHGKDKRLKETEAELFEVLNNVEQVGA